MAEALEGQIDEDIHSKCKRELKDLRAKIQSIKKSVPKGDKKKKKEVAVQISYLEKKILEICESNSQVVSTGDDKLEENIVEGMVGIDLHDNNDNSERTSHKPSKAQRRREKKAKLEREREDRITQGAVKEEDTMGHQERSKFLLLLEPLRLSIKDINPDGNCLYAAISDQLSEKINTQISVQELRKKCASYIRSHTDEFSPYIADPDTGEICTPEEFEQYCSNIEDPAVWGGQIELVALSHIYQVPITIYQASSPPFFIGDKEYANNKMLHISYHQHEYSLGNHYNSVVSM